MILEGVRRPGPAPKEGAAGDVQAIRGGATGGHVRTLLIDNHDSYTYNLFQLMAQVYGERPTVRTNDDVRWPSTDLDGFDAVVISPGPGHPGTPRDLGVCLEVLRRAALPVLGVCLGHQAIGQLCGARIRPAPLARHGHLSRVRHDGAGLFAGIPQDFVAVRYHSLCVEDRDLPADLVVTARAEDEVVMGLRHARRPLWGVQFHPESVATEHGARLLANFRDLAGTASGGPPRRSHPRATPRRRPGATRPGDHSPADRAPARWPSREHWRVLHRVVDREPDASVIFRELFGRQDYAFWLDSSRVEPGLSRFTFLGAPLGSGGEVLTYDVDSASVTVRCGGGPPRRQQTSIFDLLQARLDERRTWIPPLPFTLVCGYVGYFGYGVKGELGFVNRHRHPGPDAVWMSATRMVAIDHQAGRSHLLALVPVDDTAAERDAHRWLATAAGRIIATSDLVPAGPAGDPDHEAAGSAVDAGPYPVAPVDLETALRRPRRGYLADILECQSRLRAGDSYELCLTNTMSVPFTGDPLAAYLRQRRHNPAPYAAYLRLGDTAVLCSSPERFLRVDRDRFAESRPIKGTAPRDADPVRDRALRAGLAADPKARAENLMIVDLLRNDLGRVCEVGTVTVPRLMAVESYASVHQLVSTVRGRLPEDRTALDCARACFPGGSMTGAPKSRAVEILDEVETGPRGIYSGALGYFGLDDTADLNIVIRTALAHAGTLTIGAGGAIVLDSDPQEEYQEMLLKARAALRGLAGGQVLAEPPPRRRPKRSPRGPEMRSSQWT